MQQLMKLKMHYYVAYIVLLIYGLWTHMHHFILHLGLDVLRALHNTFVIRILKINWDCSYQDVVGLRGWYSANHSSKNSFICLEGRLSEDVQAVRGYFPSSEKISSPTN